MKISRMNGLIALSGFSATALYAAQPPDSVVSDQFQNTAMGSSALSLVTTPSKTCSNYTINPSSYFLSGCYNTAAGFGSLLSDTTGYDNTAVGANALRLNETGAYNTAVGSIALYNNTKGTSNSAFGDGALFKNTTANFNTATGTYALFSSNGTGNTADGHGSLAFNTTGTGNSAVGNLSLWKNVVGNNNTAAGAYALKSNTGSNNAAVGYQALLANTTGVYGTAIGYQALLNSQSGLGNIGVGPLAGNNIIQGQLNIDIGSWGSADESNTIRIGIAPYHQKAYIAGIYNNTGLSGLPVIITSSGQLGVGPVSSERFKTDIATMGSNTEQLSRLRPVTFKLKSDAQGTVHYGLIAEEVAKVYPELVIRDESGRIDGVHYDELAPMLLNELQKQKQVNAEQTAKIAADHSSVATLVAQHESDAARIASLEQQAAKVNELEHELVELRITLAALQSGDPVVAQRSGRE
jgi:trimeric autotransporter adhesin